MSGVSSMDDQVLRKLKSGTLSGWERIDELRQTAATVRKVVVLVHGTFAAQPSDLGDAWWQKGGRLYSELSSPSNFVVAFQWSGANSEAARRSAGRRLWVFLNQIEALRKPYVLVSHSHGGIVALHALITDTTWANSGALDVRFLSFSNNPLNALPVSHLESPAIPEYGGRNGLSNLAGWITVGTPFLNHRNRSTLTDKVLWTFVASLVLLFVGTLAGVTSTTAEVGAGTWAEMLVTSFLMCLCLGPWLLGPAVAIYWILLRRRSRMRLDSEQSTQATVAQFGRRHTGIWSRHDEAINALRAAIRSTGATIVPRMRSFNIASTREHVGQGSQKSDNVPTHIKHWIRLDSFLKFSFEPIATVQHIIGWTGRLVWDCMGWIVNTLVLVPVDWIVLKRLTQSAYGDDLPTAKCVSVSAGLSEHHEGECIEETIKTGLFAYVQERDKCVTDEVRKLLYGASTGGLDVLLRADVETATEFLVHNSYFEHDATYEAIVNEIQSRFDEYDIQR